MGKSEGDSDRKLVYVSIGLSLCVGLVLGGVILFLELRSEREIASLRSKVNGLTQEISTLRHNLRHLNNTVVALDTREKPKEDQTNDEEYEYVEEYDDPNSDSYEDDDDDSYNDTPAPPSSNLKPASLTQPADKQNDTRPKRESTFSSSILTKEIFPHSKMYNRLSSQEMKSVADSSKKETSDQSEFKLLFGSSPPSKEPLSDDKLNSTKSTSVNNHLLEGSEHIQGLPKPKKKRHLKVFSSELQSTNSMMRYKRGGRRDDVEIMTRDEFPVRSDTHRETVAAHFGADDSKCKNTRHRHCDHNDRRYHPQNHLKDWQSSSWMNLLSASSSFEMRDGVLVVQNSGLYFIYAQVFYADAHDVCGFRVYQNSQPILQCTTTTVHDASKHSHKRNSCFTGSLIHLQRGDRLEIRETEEARYTFFERTKSFFGLFKIGDV